MRFSFFHFFLISTSRAADKGLDKRTPCAFGEPLVIYRETIRTLVAATFISSLLMFAACSSSNTKNDEADGGDAPATEDVAASDGGAPQDGAPQDGAPSDGGAAPQDGSTKATKDDLTQTNGPLDGDQAATAPTDGADAKNADAKPADGAPTDAPKADDQVKGDELAKLEGDSAATNAATATAPVDAAATGDPTKTADAATPPADAAIPPADATPPADAAATPPDAATPPTVDASPSPAPIPDAAAVTEKPAKKAKSHAFVSERVPKIPANGKMVHKNLLNRFYFVRKDDNPKSISELIYGSPDRAKDLVRWNGPSWSPGRLVFYASPSNPQDSEMRSFYQERSVTPEEYTVEKGDWLSKIAAKKLGSAGSWKEIAVVNGFDKANSLEVGKRIAIYPRDLRAASGTEHVAQNDAPPPQAPPARPIPKANNGTMGQGMANTQGNPQGIPQAGQPQLNPETQPQVSQAPPPPPEEPAPKKLNKSAGPNNNLTKMIQQNLFAVAMGVLIFLLIVALLALNRRKKARLDDLSEDGFNPPTKLKRKQ
jgi:hypothetical protein